ncbi:MAG: transporter, partial [bacterium]
QDLEPRALAPAPVGLNFLLVGYVHSDGNIFFDQALPIEDAVGRIHTVTTGYVRTLGLLGASAKVGAVIPFAWGDWDGTVDGVPASTSRRGFADAAVTFSVNFIGAPARTPAQMRAREEGTVVGAACLAIVPVGQYDPARLINLGSNRWSFRTRLGASHRAGRWTFEAIGETWMFTENPEAFGGVSIRQDPILAVQLNVIRQLPRGAWLGAGYGYGEGGRTTVSGQEKDTRQVNERLGGVLVYPLSGPTSLKLAYIHGVSTRIGADFDIVSLQWQVRWGGGG